MKYRVVLNRRFSHGDADYVYLTPSASIVRLDDVSRDILEAFTCDDGLEVDAWAEAIAARPDAGDLRETFSDMVAMGLVRPADEALPPGPELPPMPFPLATLVLNVTNKCNLSCTYCYEYGEDKLTESALRRRSMMTPETAKESIDFLFESSRERTQVTITFFGGETLLNFDTIRAAATYAVERARETGKRVNFAITTNATLLTDEVIDFLVTYRFGVNVSIDGDRDAHDKHRRYKSGRGSYDDIVPRIRALLARNAGQGRPIGARVTVTAGDTDLRGLYHHLTKELGFDDVGFAPVTSAPGRDYALSTPDFSHLLSEFEALSEDYVASAVRGERHGFSNLGDLLRELHQGISKAHPCGAGLGLLGVSTEGELGLCHRFVESGDHEVGNVRDGVDEEKRTEFLRKGHVSNKPDCENCFARPLCAGGCYHEAQVRYGDASLPNLHYCDYIRSWTDLGLHAYARIMADNPAFFEAFES